MKNAIKPDIARGPNAQDLLRQIRRDDVLNASPSEVHHDHKNTAHDIAECRPVRPDQTEFVSEVPAPQENQAVGADGAPDRPTSDRIRQQMDRLRRELETQLALLEVRSSAQKRGPQPLSIIDVQSGRRAIEADNKTTVEPFADQPVKSVRPKPQNSRNQLKSWFHRSAVRASTLLNLLLCTAILAALACSMSTAPFEAGAHHAANRGAAPAGNSSRSGLID